MPMRYYLQDKAAAQRLNKAVTAVGCAILRILKGCASIQAASHAVKSPPFSCYREG